jgi:uncharacterized membrane protein
VRTMTAHGHAPHRPSSPTVRRRLVVAIAPLFAATLGGLLVLWPSGDGPSKLPAPVDERFDATVVSVQEGRCETAATVGVQRCSNVKIRLEQGPDRGTTFTIQEAAGENVRTLEPGDSIIVARPAQQPPGAVPAAQPYYFVDYQRQAPLIILLALFAAVVIALSRLRGLFSLIGLVVSFGVLLWFVIPAILDGGNPVAVAIVGAAAVMFIALYLAHGFNARTSSAVLGTLVSLGITGILAVLFVDLARFTGLASEEALFLQVSAQQVNVKGLLLGGIIIGTLGVLDDVTITQSSAVWELHLANRAYGTRELYRAAVRIGRDHIASTVNTLVLAYAGASLPLLIVFNLSSRPLGEVLTTEVISEEIVRTLVGSIGLVASVPITTALTAVVVGHRSERMEGGPEKDQVGQWRSRFEREWFGPPPSHD